MSGSLGGALASVFATKFGSDATAPVKERMNLVTFGEPLSGGLDYSNIKQDLFVTGCNQPRYARVCHGWKHALLDLERALACGLDQGCGGRLRLVESYHMLYKMPAGTFFTLTLSCEHQEGAMQAILSHTALLPHCTSATAITESNCLTQVVQLNDGVPRIPQYFPDTGERFHHADGAGVVYYIDANNNLQVCLSVAVLSSESAWTDVQP